MSKLNQSKQNKNGTMFRSNPVMNRLGKIDEVAGSNEKAAGYGRIAVKTAYFLLVTLAGMMGYLILNNTVFASLEQTLTFSYKGFTASTSVTQVLIFSGVAVLAIISQLVAAFARGTIPVSGTIYSACQGFIISFIVFTLLKGYEYLGLLALAITVAVVFSMAMLYYKGIISVTKKFYMVLISALAAMIAISLISFIGYLIPLTRPFVASVLGNFWISIGMTLLSIVIACLFLISDFAMVDHVVANRMPAKYEWMASFGLAFAILWLYVKILDLIIQIAGNSKN